MAGRAITSNAGSVLLREIDRSMGLLEQLTTCFTDCRSPRLVGQASRSLVAQRITGLSVGYQYLNDHDALRHDPVLALLVGRSTMNRLLS